MNANLIVTLLTQLLPLVSKAGVSSDIEAVISTLIQILPTVVQEATDLVAPISNIISALQGNATVTTAQLDQLASLQAAMDQSFEAAAAAAGDPDPDPTDTAAQAAAAAASAAPVAAPAPAAPAAMETTAPVVAPVEPAAPPVAT